MKFTEGPWSIQTFTAPPGKFVSATKIIGMDGVHICQMTGNDTEANARLIAAAPELFEKLAELILCTTQSFTEGERSMIRQECWELQDRILGQIPEES